MTENKDFFTKEQMLKIVEHLTSCGINPQEWNIQNGNFALLGLDNNRNVNASSITPVFYISHIKTKEMKLFNSKLVGII